jgi:hypothetical protein
MKKNNVYGQEFVGYGIVFILMTGTIMTYMGGCTEKNEKSIDSIKKDLPQGMSFTEIKSYLKRTKCEYIYDEQTKCFTAILRDVDKKAFTSQSITMIIKMDEHDKLKDLDIKVVHTGP